MPAATSAWVIYSKLWTWPMPVAADGAAAEASSDHV